MTSSSFLLPGLLKRTNALAGRRYYTRKLGEPSYTRFLSFSILVVTAVYYDYEEWG